MPELFRNLDVATIYGPNAVPPIKFYEQVLPNAVTVRLGLGYFASTAFEALAQSFRWWSNSIPSFSLVVNDQLSPDDISTLTSFGSIPTNPNEISIETFQRMWKGMAEHKRRGFEFLRFLLEHEKLEMKVAVANTGGIVHHKFAIFHDGAGDHIVSQGSLNFSASALQRNVETMHTVLGWKADPSGKETARYYIELFKSLWNNTMRDTQVLSGHSLTSFLLAVVPRRDSEYFVQHSARVTLDSGQMIDDDNFFVEDSAGPRQQLRSYQEAAIQHWLENGCRDIWAMATGTGKTLTAIHAIRRLRQRASDRSLLLVIVVPSTVLVDQWKQQLQYEDFLNLISAFGSVSQWETDLIRTIRSVAAGRASSAIVATHEAFKKHISHRIDQVASQTMLIVDEVHSIGTESGLAALPTLVPWRLGLSATPLRQYDADGSESLLNYFGSKGSSFFNYSIADAIADGYLCPYSYEPHFIELTEEETKEYGELSAKISKIINSDDPEIKAACNQLLIKRHRIVERAVAKIEPTIEIVDRISSNNHRGVYGIIYSPDGDFPANEKVGEAQPWIDVIMQRIRKVGARAHRFVQGDSHAILHQLSEGHLDWIVAKKRLDEGVDIPRAEYAIIVASSRTLRQYVQRRGRVLRPHADKTSAHIVDFVVVPAVDGEIVTPFGKALVVHELGRLKEFVNASSNRNEVEDKVRKVAELYDIEYDEITSPKGNEEANEYDVSESQ